MKQVRNVLFTVISMLAAFAAVVYTSCTKDPCKGITCFNGGACSGGACACPTGYTGTQCEIEQPGEATFWIDEDTGGGPITVTISGSSAGISQYFPSGYPGCGSTGCASFDLVAGSYNFTAVNSAGNWSGAITIEPGICSPQRLSGPGE